MVAKHPKKVTARGKSGIINNNQEMASDKVYYDAIHRIRQIVENDEAVAKGIMSPTANFSLNQFWSRTKKGIALCIDDANHCFPQFYTPFGQVKILHGGDGNKMELALERLYKHLSLTKISDEMPYNILAGGKFRLRKYALEKIDDYVMPEVPTIEDLIDRVDCDYKEEMKRFALVSGGKNSF
jgi:hypothetical protein